MRPGSMRWRVAILRETETGRDNLNDPVLSWSTLRTVWADKIIKAGGESFDAGQRHATNLVAFRTYYMSDIVETDRLLCDGVTYDIRDIREFGFRAGLEITGEVPGVES